MGAAPKDQGHYFGLMQGFFNFGTTFTGMIVGPVAESEYMIPIFGETDGWRISFAAVSSAAFIGSNAVPILIRWLGSEDIEYNDEPDLDQARALGTAQAIIVCIPWMICFCVYSGLLWAFPYDLKRKEAEESVDNTELVQGASL